MVARTVRRTERYSDDFALFETDPAVRQPIAGAAARRRRGAADPGPVFTLGGAGPPRTATNTVAERGRRLRRGWGFASVVGVLLIVFWVYNDLIAPIFGWPRLEE